jgi:hypothetical protein
MNPFGYEEEFDFIPEVDIEELENEKQGEPLVLLERIDRIVKIHSFMKNSRENKGKDSNYQKTLDEHLAVCSDILGISALQTLLFTYILNSGSLSLGHLANSLKVTRVQCFKYLDDLDVLLNKRLIRKSDRGEEEIDSNYWIPYEVIQALREGKVFIPPRYRDLSKDEFFKHLSKLLSRFFQIDSFDRKITKKIFMMDFFNLLEDNPQLEFVKKINSLLLTEENIIFLSFLCTQFYVNREDVFHYRNFDFSEYIGGGKDIDLNQLFKMELVEYYGDDFKDKEHIVLTNKAIIELLGITEALHKPKQESCIINHENIVQKELFYNAKEGKLVEQLADLLLEKNYKNVTERLKSKGMRTGFSCLLFGVPGTGKTETVYQIARMADRDIMPIDISETKSHWFGESEKIIKNIFSGYRHKVKKAENNNIPVPILLLNEADAIINKRKDTSTSSVAQTENAIQNIILEELEKLNGIMIATTNLTENFDTAFERRFIYKIEFQKPDVEIRRLIWRSLIPELKGEETIKLAEAFDLSGGQIENIARKRTIVGILSGKDPALADLVSFCDEESKLKKDQKIGF